MFLISYTLHIITYYSYALASYSFFFNDTATTEIYTLSLHDALPISAWWPREATQKRICPLPFPPRLAGEGREGVSKTGVRSEEHTSELQSHVNLVCRLLLEKKK